VTLTDTTCVNGTTYYYAVSAVFSVGAGLRSAEVSATPVAPITLPSPTNLSAIAGDGQVRLAWLKTVGATSYTIWRSTTHGGPYAQLANLVSNSFFTDTTCRNGLTYFYVVSAVYAAGESTQSAEISAAPQAIPGNVVATAGDARVDVAWSMVLNVTGYTVWRATALDGPYATMATGITATTWSDTTCENGTTYYYAVSADSGSRSQGVAATPIAVLHTVPTGVTAIAGDAHVDLAWVAADGATGYTIRRATVSGGPYSALIENLAATEFTDTTCKNGTTYYYIVSATGSGDGDHSAEVSARPDLPMKEPTSLACGFGSLVALLLAFALLLRQRLRIE
jgi:cellulose 1,4-beta-cellobiosidase